MTDIDTAVVDAKSRATRNWHSDGLYTLGLSATMVLLGSIFLIPMRSLWQGLAFYGLALALMYVLSARTSPLLKWLKSRITYPRTGYAATDVATLRQEEGKHNPGWWILCTFGLFGIDSPPWIGLIALAACLGFLCGSTRGKFEFAWLFIPGLALSGILVSLPQVAQTDRMAFLLIALGALYAIKGAIQLARYLLQHPAPRP